MYDLVGLTGKAGSGKDTAAEGLTDHVVMKFATPVYLGVYRINQWIRLSLKEQVDYGFDEFVHLQKLVDKVGWDKAKENPEVREALQKYGTEAGRDIHGGDCWVNAWKRAYQALPKGTKVKVTDVRFPNEDKAIKELEGVVIEVLGPPRRAGVNSTHASEQGIGRRADITLVNEGTVEDLHKAIRRVVGYENPS